jgi:23S rRNA pseudouridine2605 synthase
VNPRDPSWKLPRPFGLGRALAKAGYGTRKQTDEIVRSGRVRVDGRVVVDPATQLDPNSRVELDGKPLSEAPRHYLALHKPTRVFLRDGETDGSRLVSDFLPPDLAAVWPAGRLDAQTSGLVLLSNDAAWNARAAAARGVEREYRLEIAGTVSDLELDLVASGVHVTNAGLLRPRRIEVVARNPGSTLLELVLTQGRNRQIRRIFRTLRHEVLSMQRTRIGGVSLDNLPEGKFRELTVMEIASIGRTDGRVRSGG